MEAREKVRLSPPDYKVRGELSLDFWQSVKLFEDSKKKKRDQVTEDFMDERAEELEAKLIEMINNSQP